MFQDLMNLWAAGIISLSISKLRRTTTTKQMVLHVSVNTFSQIANQDNSVQGLPCLLGKQTLLSNCLNQSHRCYRPY